MGPRRPQPDELLAPYDGDVCGAFGDDLSTRRSSQLSGGVVGGRGRDGEDGRTEEERDGYKQGVEGDSAVDLESIDL